MEKFLDFELSKIASGLFFSLGCSSIELKSKSLILKRLAPLNWHFHWPFSVGFELFWSCWAFAFDSLCNWSRFFGFYFGPLLLGLAGFE
jgi:hypothetical protein